MAEELVHYRVDGNVSTVELDSQSNRNALSRQLVHELLEGIGRAEVDDDVKVVVIRAAGPTFCSGADLSEAGEVGMEEAAGVLVSMQRRIATLSKPVVTRIEGAVRAGGIGIVAASDIAVCSARATFAFTEVRLGLAPAAISLSVLPRMTDRAAALTFLTGDIFDGAAAGQMGLVTEVVAADALDAEVEKICTALGKGNPQGLRETKKLIGGPLVERIDRYGADLAKLSAKLFASEEAKAAMLAFLQRKR